MQSSRHRSCGGIWLEETQEEEVSSPQEAGEDEAKRKEDTIHHGPRVVQLQLRRRGVRRASTRAQSL